MAAHHRPADGRTDGRSVRRNVALDPPSILLMDSGAYTIQEFICTACEAYLGWKFARAHDGSERWKEGHYVLELELVSPAPPSPNDDFAFAFDADAEADELQARAEAEFGVGMGMGVGMEREGMGMERERERTGVLAIARESPLVKMQMQVQAEQQEQIHKRSMSAGPPRPGQPQPLGKGGAREGYRSLQAGPKQMGVQPMRRVERDSDGREGGPFWKPR